METTTIELDEQQSYAFKKVKLGYNIFITGSGGVGKSLLLKHIIRWAGNKAEVCAPTWKAINNLGVGSSLNSAFMINPALIKERLIKYDTRGEVDTDGTEFGFSKRLGVIKILIIDEISMVSGDMLMFLDAKIQRMRCCSAPFGGLQLVFVGDFCQLPPIEFLRYKFAFETPVWERVFSDPESMISLSKVHRQEDKEFVKILNEVRLGGGYEKLGEMCNRSVPTLADGSIDPTAIHLSPLRKFCLDINNGRLGEIDKPVVKIEAYDITTNIRKASKNEKFAIPEKIETKESARILLIKNLEPKRRFCNGKILTIRKYFEVKDTSIFNCLSEESKKELAYHNNRKNTTIFKLLKKQQPTAFLAIDAVDDEGVGVDILPYVEIIASSGKIKTLRVGLPILNGYAVTLHRIQGSTLDTKVVLHVNGVFENGMIYVGASRCTKLENLFIIGDLPDSNELDSYVDQFMDNFEE